jgi:hypothetical protein
MARFWKKSPPPDILTRLADLGQQNLPAQCREDLTVWFSREYKGFNAEAFRLKSGLPAVMKDTV